MPTRNSQIDQAVCPCGSEVEYSLCCLRYLSGAEIPQHAEQLMRSRYCGFVTCDETYLLATWHPDTRPSKVSLDGEQRWLGLSLRATEAGRVDDVFGTVEFVARFKVDGKGHRLHEISRFEKIDGCWYYLDGQHL
ncbi:MAG: SEC-C motif-containing protein [Halioglobus sp.]|jgi:SEC-C motif-containing protein